jgi:hypothetical protein
MARQLGHTDTCTALYLLGRVRFGWICLGAALKTASLANYSMLSRSVPLLRLLRTDLPSLGISHVSGVAPQPKSRIGQHRGAQSRPDPPMTRGRLRRP